MKTSALLTDFYELTMAAAYFRSNMAAEATFSLFIREYPAHRSYFVSAGLEDVIAGLESFRFAKEDLDYLDRLGLFSQEFLQSLAALRFTGEVFAMPEGRIFFRNEPVLEITAPVIEAQLVETFILNTVNLQAAIASKAARCVHAARGRNLVDFSLRRTQGADAGMKVARSSYMTGFESTSNVLAGKRYGIPVSGTMAHSFVESFQSEEEAFRAFAEAFPQNTVLLIDTYDTLAGAAKAVRVAKDLAAKGLALKGVRLDSGDMATLSRQVRSMFVQNGLEHVAIFASGGFDEYKIARMVEEDAEIDAFGVGTRMGVSADAPYTDMAYKLVEYDRRPVLKLSSGKQSLVGRKQVWRVFTAGQMKRDTIAQRDEVMEGQPLLQLVMNGGKRVNGPEPLDCIRTRFREDLNALGGEYKSLETPSLYPVQLGPALSSLQERCIQEVRRKELGER